VPSWKTKALLQNIISLFPWRQKLYHWLRRHILGTLDSSPQAHYKRLEWTGRHITYYLEHTGRSSLPPTILELGTGEFTTVPMALFLCGAEKILTIDIEQLFSRAYFLDMLESLAGCSPETLQSLLPLFNAARLEHLQSLSRQAEKMTLSQILTSVGIEARVTDARQTGLPERSVDLIISNTTLEHIPPEILPGILTEFNRILRLDGIMSHLVDMSDHYEHTDHSITPYHYLQYDLRTWKRYNSPFIYQNRLRLPDYVQLIEKAGFEALETWTYAANPDLLAQVNLAPAFQHYTPEALAVTHLWSVSKVKQ
jgi:hypothetical protein